jgi:hypothetical protein
MKLCLFDTIMVLMELFFNMGLIGHPHREGSLEVLFGSFTAFHSARWSIILASATYPQDKQVMLPLTVSMKIWRS